jgi:hypothetical protein
VKKQEPVWAGGNSPYIVDYRDIEFTVEEQQHINSEVFANQDKFEFLVRSASYKSKNLRRVSIAGIDPNIYPNQSLVSRARKLLMQRNGESIDVVLEDIEKRLPSKGVKKLLSRSKGNTKSQNNDKPSIWNK